MNEEISQEYNQKKMEQKQADDNQEQLENALKQLMEPSAKQRLNNIRLANETLYARTAQAILSLYQNKVLTSKLTEEQLKQVLQKISEKRQTIIRRK